MSVEAEPRSWELWAQDSDDPQGYLFIERWMEALLFSGVPQRKIVRVRVIEDENGFYRGWVYEGSKNIDMVLHKRIFEMQFANGSKAEENAGHGKPVTVRIEKISK